MDEKYTNYFIGGGFFPFPISPPFVTNHCWMCHSSLAFFLWVSINWVTWIWNTHLNPRLKRFKIRWPCKCDQTHKKWHWKISVVPAYFTSTAVTLLEALQNAADLTVEKRGDTHLKKKSNSCNELYQVVLISLKSKPLFRAPLAPERRKCMQCQGQ